MRLWLVVAGALVAGLVTAGAVYFSLNPHEEFPDGTQSLPYFFSVGETPGVDTGTDIFRLGRVTPTGSSWRSLSIEASVSSAVTEAQAVRRVVIVARGDGSAWIAAEPAIVTLPAQVNITLRAPLDAAFGEYRGTLYVVPYP